MRTKNGIDRDTEEYFPDKLELYLFVLPKWGYIGFHQLQRSLLGHFATK